MEVGPRTRRRTGFGASGGGAARELPAGAGGAAAGRGVIACRGVGLGPHHFFGFSGGAAVSALGGAVEYHFALSVDAQDRSFCGDRARTTQVSCKPSGRLR